MLVLLGMIAIFALGFFFEGQEELSRQSRRATIVKQILGLHAAIRSVVTTRQRV